MPKIERLYELVPGHKYHGKLDSVIDCELNNVKTISGNKYEQGLLSPLVTVFLSPFYYLSCKSFRAKCPHRRK